MKILPDMYVFWINKFLLNFGGNPLLDPDLRIFQDSSALQDNAFFYSLAHVSGKTDHIFMKMLSQTYLWIRKSQLNFESHQDLDRGPPWWSSALPECCCLLCI